MSITLVLTLSTILISFQILRKSNFYTKLITSYFFTNNIIAIIIINFINKFHFIINLAILLLLLELIIVLIALMEKK